MSEPYVTSEKVYAALCGVAPITVRRWMAKESLGFPKPVVINRVRYWRMSEIVDWMESRKPAPAADKAA